MSIRINGVAPLLQVYDMPTSIAFYRDLLSFTLVSTSQPGPRYDWAMLELGGATVMLNTKYEGDTRPLRPERVCNDVILYFGCENVDEAHAELRARGWTRMEEPATAHYGMRQLYLQDPDGFSLCFQHPAGV